MNCKSIYEAALALIGEPVNDNSTADYQARAVKLFFLALIKYRSLSTAVCGIDHKLHTLFITNLDSNFPLDQRAMVPVTYYLASLLILDELPELSDMLEKKSEQSAKDVEKEATTVNKIVEVY